MRTFGVEEELLLVDEETGRPVPAASRVLAKDVSVPRMGGGRLTAEMQQEMVEVVTRVHTDALELAAEVRAGRSAADTAARAVGVRAAALATSPLPVHPHPTQKVRYTTMMQRFGALARESLACGMHVHVSIESPEEGVAVLDRIRVWLPVIVALSANSPFCHGEDTGYASWRTIAWHQWPNAGPNPVFGTVDAYRAYERRLLTSNVVLDEAMLYFAARLSHAHPTVEVRVADVPLDATATVAIAAIVRGLVDTAAEEWRYGVPAPDEPEALLRLASWQAALRGVHGPLVDPFTGEQSTSGTVIARLLAHIMPALERAGDDRLVLGVMGTILEDGTGADVQRAAAGPDLAAAVRAAVTWTHLPAAARLDPRRQWTPVS
jgi:carboxylate-amine ligase